MNSLILGPQGSLIYRNLYGPDNGPYEQEVASHAIAFLFEKIELHPQVRLRDLLSLFDACPALHQVFSRQWSKDVSKQVQLGSVAPKPSSNDEAGNIEYLQLSWNWQLDTYSNTYSNTQLLDLVGVSQQDGKQTSWCLALTPIRELLELPLRLKEHFAITEQDVDARYYGQEVAKANCHEMTLGLLIHSVLEELTFHGDEESKEQILAGLKKQTDEIEAGTAQFVSGDDVFEEILGPSRQKSIATMFETIGSLSARELIEAIDGLADVQPIGSALARQFGTQVVIKEAYRNLAARAFRRVFRLAGE